MMHQSYNEFGYPSEMNMELQDDNPDLTDIRATRTSDLAIIENIDLKSQETPMDRSELASLMKLEDVHGILAIRKFQNVGFCLFNIQDNGETVFINRFSIAHGCLDLGVGEKMIESLRSTLDGGPPARLRMVVSEHDLGSPMFNKLIGLGFVATGTIRNHFFEYSRVYGTDRNCDGIKLELS